jgi:cold shock CspA family protein
MSSEQQQETTTPSTAQQTAVNTSPDRRLGRVKWFNNKAGYGFLKVVENDGRESDDVFVHHSSIKVSKEQFKYLVQGEYIDFTIGTIESGEHKFQATEVSGVNGCKLMCETRNESFRSRSDNRPQRSQQQQQQQQQGGDRDTERRRYQRSDAPPPEELVQSQRSFPRQRQPYTSQCPNASAWTKVEHKPKRA